MAPPPEYDKEPKAPDKSATITTNEDSKSNNLANDLQTNSDLKTEDAAAIEVETKHVETLDDGQLRALLDEAIQYKRPKDREGKSNLFKELLEEVEQDEEEDEAAHAKEVQDARTRLVLSHANSMQDLMAALKGECHQRAVRNHHPKRYQASVSERATQGGSLPSGVNKVFNEPTGTYFATVHCINPPPLNGRRVSASDANGDANVRANFVAKVDGNETNGPTELELLNKRSMTTFPMYTARATLEIGSGSVCTGRAVTTTTASNQVRTAFAPTPLPSHTRFRDRTMMLNRQHRSPSNKPDCRQTMLLNALRPKIDDEKCRGGGECDYTDSHVAEPRGPISLDACKGFTKSWEPQVVDPESLSYYLNNFHNENKPAKCKNELNQKIADYLDRWYEQVDMIRDNLSPLNMFRKYGPNDSIFKHHHQTYYISNMDHNFADPNFNDNIALGISECNDYNTFKNIYSSTKNKETYTEHYFDYYKNNRNFKVLDIVNEKPKENNNIISQIKKYQKHVGNIEIHSMSSSNPRNVRNMSIGNRNMSHDFSDMYRDINITQFNCEAAVNVSNIVTCDGITRTQRSEKNKSSQELTPQEVHSSSEVLGANKEVNTECSIQLSNMPICQRKYASSNIYSNNLDEDKKLDLRLEPLLKSSKEINSDSEHKVLKVNNEFTSKIFTTILDKKSINDFANISKDNSQVTNDILAESPIKHTLDNERDISYLETGFISSRVFTNTELKQHKMYSNKSIQDCVCNTNDLLNISNLRNDAGADLNSKPIPDWVPKCLKAPNNTDEKIETKIVLTSQQKTLINKLDEKNHTNYSAKNPNGYKSPHATENTRTMNAKNSDIVVSEESKDQIMLTNISPNAYILSPNSHINNIEPSVHVNEVNNKSRTLVASATSINAKKNKVNRSVANKENETDNKTNPIKAKLLQNLLKRVNGTLVQRNPERSSTDAEVDSAIPFSCITTPEVVASCNTTSSTLQSAVAVDPKPLQLGSCYRAVASLTGAVPALASASAPAPAPDSASASAPATTVPVARRDQPRNVIGYNGLTGSRQHGFIVASAPEEHKKSLDENGNAVQGISSPGQHKKPRKKKSSKNETVIDLHQIVGYQGNKDLNELLRFIESNADGGRGSKLSRAKHKDDADDKGGKKRSHERRKDKENKITRATSMEELSRTKLEDLTVEAVPRADKKERRSEGADPKPERRSWGDDARHAFCYRAPPEPAPEPPVAAELTDFQTVTKRRKPRRRADEPERDAPRRPRAPDPRPRRESAPPSDRNSDSNDDLDSVHSLPADATARPVPLHAPIQSSPPAPPPTAPAAPHASYADIARTRHNIPDLIESCNFYAEGEGGGGEPRRAEPAPAPGDADGYPALEAPAGGRGGGAARAQGARGRGRVPGAGRGGGPAAGRGAAGPRVAAARHGRRDVRVRHQRAAAGLRPGAGRAAASRAAAARRLPDAALPAARPAAGHPTLAADRRLHRKRLGGSDTVRRQRQSALLCGVARQCPQYAYVIFSENVT